jgi:hypothetical protein
VFRRKVLAEIASRSGIPTLTIAQQEQVAMAVSCDAEITEISALYLQGKASDAKMSRLHLVRAQLMRLLDSLGLTDAAGEPDPQDDNAPPANATPEERRAWSQRYITDALSSKAATR